MLVGVAVAALALSPGVVPASRASRAILARAPRAASILLAEDGAKPDLAYAEQSRAYRRTVYFHDSWVKHRSSDRFFRNFASTLDSGVLRSLYTEIASVTGVSIFIVIANMLLSGYDDFSNVHHVGPISLPAIKALALPALPFTVAMPALSLLLVFRTNTAYSRWNEARTLWGGIVNTCRNLQRQSNVFFGESAAEQQLRVEFANQCAAFPKALRSFLRGADDDPIFKQDATRLLGAETAEALMMSKNRPTFVCNMMSATVKRANLDPMDRARMDECVSKLVDYLGACERIFRSPIPLVYTRHTARFLTSFMVLLPLALWAPMGETWNHWGTIPATATLAIFLFGIEELGIQIEEPFGILPLEALCDGSIEAVVMDMRDSYVKGHFGPLDSVSPTMFTGRVAQTAMPAAIPEAPPPATATVEPEVPEVKQPTVKDTYVAPWRK